MQSVAEFLCSRKSYEQVAKPIIADLQFEYFEALREGRRAKAAWDRARGFCSFWMALGLFRLTKTVVDVWRKVNSI